MTLFELSIKGGPIMIVLFILSIISLYIIIERFIKLSRVKRQDKRIIFELEESFATTDLTNIEKVCSIMIHIPLAEIIYEAIQSLKTGNENINDFVNSAVDTQINSLEKNLGFLSTLAAVSPLIGFLGTVTGMIKVFMKIQNTGGGVDITLLAGGIWEALITTVAGLIIGITSLIFYNILVDNVERISVQMNKTTQKLLISTNKEK